MSRYCSLAFRYCHNYIFGMTVYLEDQILLRRIADFDIIYTHSLLIWNVRQRMLIVCFNQSSVSKRFLFCIISDLTHHVKQFFPRNQRYAFDLLYFISQTYIHTYIPTYINTYMHTYIHAYIHTYVQYAIHTKQYIMNSIWYIIYNI